MKAVPHFLQEDSILILKNILFQHFILNQFFVFRSPQIRNFSRIQQIIYILQKSFLRYLIIIDEEDRPGSFESAGDHAFLEILSEVALLEVFLDFQRGEVAFIDESSESSEGLLSATSYSNE